MTAEKHSTIRTACLVALAVVAVCAALFFARELLVPIVFAALLNALFRPVVRALDRILPTPVSSAIVVLALVGAIVAGAMLAGRPIRAWVEGARQSMSTAQDKFKRVLAPLHKASDAVSEVTSAMKSPATAPSGAPTPVAVAPPSPSLADGLGYLRAFFSGLVEVLLLLYLLLAAGEMFVQKLIKVIPRYRDKADALETVRQTQAVVARYMLATALINLGQASLVVIVLWWLKFPSPVLWGIGCFILEFVPYLGATVMVALLAVVGFASFDSLPMILSGAGCYLLLTTIQNNVVSPYVYGQRLKLNPVAVLVGVLFWWFIWGIPGAFLAVPLVATAKIIADRSEPLKPIGEFLGE